MLLNTRGAADLLGATKMDRPEDIERNPVTGAVYAAMTNNKARTAEQVDAANPRAANKCGHILEILEEKNDAGARRFRWSLFLVCGDPKDPSTYFAGFPKEKVSAVSAPDNVAFVAESGQRDAGEEILLNHGPMNAQITAAASVDPFAVTYLLNGFALNPNGASLALCDERGNVASGGELSSARGIFVSVTGRAGVTRDKDRIQELVDAIGDVGGCEAS